MRYAEPYVVIPEIMQSTWYMAVISMEMVGWVPIARARERIRTTLT
jgi:hypothetical protein